MIFLGWFFNIFGLFFKTFLIIILTISQPTVPPCRLSWLKGDTDASFFGEWQKLYKNSKHRSNENKAEPAKQNKYFSAEQLWEV
jgi:hypothetical protein